MMAPLTALWRLLSVMTTSLARRIRAWVQHATLVLCCNWRNYCSILTLTVVDPTGSLYMVAKFLPGLCSRRSELPPLRILLSSCVAVAPVDRTCAWAMKWLSTSQAVIWPSPRVLEEVGGLTRCSARCWWCVDICWRLQDKGYTIGF